MPGKFIAARGGNLFWLGLLLYAAAASEGLAARVSWIPPACDKSLKSFVLFSIIRNSLF